MKAEIICCLLFCTLSSILGARILAVLPLPMKSHFIFCQSVLSALATRGHQVTVFSPFVPKSNSNIKHIDIQIQAFEALKKRLTFERFEARSKHKSYFGFEAINFWRITYPICEEFLRHEKMKELVDSKERFDLVMGEVLFGEESLAVLGHLFKAPVVNLNGFSTWSIINRIHGNALQIPYAPDPVSFAFSDHMSFLERFRNLVSTTKTLFLYYFDHLPKHEDIIMRVFKDPQIPPLSDMLHNISLTLANFHPTLGYAHSYSSNIVPVGGIHIEEDIIPLPEDVKDFMGSGKDEVIYFSLGSLVPVHLMPKEYMKIFTNVFRRLPYKILWKIELDTIPDLPKNVMIAKWLPQQSILAHPNCVLFITHGGRLSQLEAFHAGVPVVGIPFFGDQQFNVRLYEELGVGVKLDFGSLTEESMYKAINSVVGKPKVLENAKKVSLLLHHRPMSPADTAVFWVEYVMQHGAQHLRPAAATMPWYQLALLDIVGAILVALITVTLVIKKFLSLLLRLCCGENKDSVTGKKKNN